MYISHLLNDVFKCFELFSISTSLSKNIYLFLVMHSVNINTYFFSIFYYLVFIINLKNNST